MRSGLAMIFPIAERSDETMKTRISISACRHAILITERGYEPGIPLEIDGEERTITGIEIKEGRWYSGDHRLSRQEQEQLTQLSLAIIERDRSPRTPPTVSISLLRPSATSSASRLRWCLSMSLASHPRGLPLWRGGPNGPGGSGRKSARTSSRSWAGLAKRAPGQTDRTRTTGERKENSRVLRSSGRTNFPYRPTVGLFWSGFKAWEARRRAVWAGERSMAI